MANNALETYIELLPKMWFVQEIPRNPRMTSSGSILLAEYEAFEKVNPLITKYDQPKDPRVAYYTGLSSPEKIEFLCALDLTEINKFIYKGYYQAGRFNEAKPKTYTYIDYLYENFPHLHNHYQSLCDSVKNKSKEEDKPKEDKPKEDKPKEDKPKKKAIPKALKASVWINYIGKDIGATKCPCCNTHEITQLSFDCGHVIAEALGGKTTLENLRPICSKCNKSMRTTHMDEFKKQFFQ